MSQVYRRLIVLFAIALTVTACSKKDEKAKTEAEAPKEEAKNEADVSEAKPDVAEAPTATADAAATAPSEPAKEADASAPAEPDQSAEPEPPKEPERAPGLTVKETHHRPGYGIKYEPIVAPEATSHRILFWIEKKGLVQLDDSGFKTLVAAPKNITIETLDVAPDGTVFGFGNNAYRFTEEGTAEKTVSKGEIDYPYFNGGAVGLDGAAAMSGTLKFGVRRGDQFLAFEPHDVVGESQWFQDLLWDANGNLWVMAGQSVAVLEAGQDIFKKVVDIQGEYGAGYGRFNTFATRDDGVLLFVQNDTIMAYSGERLESHQPFSRGHMGNDTMHVGADGTMHVVGQKGAWALDRYSMKPVHKLEFEKASLPIGSVAGSALDGQGRLWLATDNGLLVIDPEYKHTHFPAGSLPDLGGNVKAVVAIGNGPAGLPTEGPSEPAPTEPAPSEGGEAPAEGAATP